MTIFKLRSTSPSEKSSHPKGLIIAKIEMVGASKRTIGAAASFHFGPRRTKITSLRKESTGNRNGQGQSQDQRVAFEEVALETNGIVLESG